MSGPKRILFVADSKDYTDKLLLTDIRKRVKGFLRLGHDTQVFSPNLAMSGLGPVRQGAWVRAFYKPRMEELLERQIRNYVPDIVYIGFAKYLDARTVERIRRAAPGAFLLGYDVDIYPELQENRVDAAAGFDVLMTTYAGRALAPYERRGVRCVFMPNICDPDIERRYDAGPRWKSDILFTGRIAHRKYPTDPVRSEILNRLRRREGFVCYGAQEGRPIGGLEYYYAISGARIGLSINADNSIPLYHSDRLTQYMACGTLVLAKRVPETGRLFEDRRHLRYFDSADEFFEIADEYLRDEPRRRRLAEQGMEYVHREFACEKIARYTLDVVEKGTYSAPWNQRAGDETG